MSRLIRLLRRFAPRNDERGLVAIIPLLLLLAGLGAGLYLVQNPQIFRPKASSQEVQLILKSNDATSCAEVKDGRETITCPEVKLKLLSPLEKKTSDNSGINMSLVKTAYAAEGDGSFGGYCKADEPTKVFKHDEVRSGVFAGLCGLGGTAIGFAAGTIVPGIGNLIGAAGGFVVGMGSCAITALTNEGAIGSLTADPINCPAGLVCGDAADGEATCVEPPPSFPRSGVPTGDNPLESGTGEGSSLDIGRQTAPPPAGSGSDQKKLPAPTITKLPSCINENYQGEGIIISWSAEPEVGESSVWIGEKNNSFAIKKVGQGEYSTLVTAGFKQLGDRIGEPLLLQPSVVYQVARNAPASGYNLGGSVEFSIPKCTSEEDKAAGGQEPEEIKPEPISEGVQPRNYSPIGTLTLSPTQNTVNFQWHGAKGAKKYRVMIDDVPKSGKKSAAGGCEGYDNYFCTDRVPNVNGTAGSDGVTETGRFSLMLANTPLEVDKTYKWWVDALDANGNPVSNNATSVGKTFTVIAQPVAVPPAGPAAVVADALKPLLCPNHDGESYPQCGNTIGLEGKDPTHVYTVIPQFDCNNKPALPKIVDSGVSSDCPKPAEAPAAAGSPALPGAPAECTTGPVGTISEQISSCVIEKGPSNLVEFYRQNGWCVESSAHKRMLVNDWYSKLAPQADKDRVASCFPGAAPGATRTTKGFRISESAANVGATPLIPYQEGQGGVEYTYPLSSSANGPYYLYIVFYDQDEKAINLTPYTLALIKESPASGNPVEPVAPPPPASETDACKLSCGACPSKTDKCNNTVYTGTCDYSTCTGPGATYRCTSSSNNNCSGVYECGISCIGTSNSPTPPPPPAAADACNISCGSCPSKVDKCGNTVYQGSCDYSSCTGPGATYRCTSSSNSSCSGYYECGISCIGTSSTSPTSPTAPPPASSIFDDGYENPDD